MSLMLFYMEIKRRNVYGNTPGISSEITSGKIYKVKKALYGLKQSKGLV